MANFQTHVTTSTMLGFGYAGAGLAFGMPIEVSLVAGGLCGVSGMLPDLDSDSGIPLRETMSFTAAIVPMMLVERLQTLNLEYDMMVLVAASTYLLVRFGLARMIKRCSVHRGMFHSIPAGLIFAGGAYLICGGASDTIRQYKAGAVFAGFMSHLFLDEIYSVEWKGGRWRFKSSFGTAVKFWSKSAWANFSTYAKLAVVVLLIFSEPNVMARFEKRHPGLIDRYQQLQNQFTDSAFADSAASTLERFSPRQHGPAIEPRQPAPGIQRPPEGYYPYPQRALGRQNPAPPPYPSGPAITNGSQRAQGPPRSQYDTAQRPAPR